MDLQELCGEHELTGVDQSFQNDSRMQLRIVLDENVYVAQEGYNDGYRSEMEELRKDNRLSVPNRFFPVKVFCVYRTKGSYGPDDILEIIDFLNGEIILEFGTENIDDYYPQFISNWMPERMHVNERKDDGKETRS